MRFRVLFQKVLLSCVLTMSIFFYTVPMGQIYFAAESAELPQAPHNSAYPIVTVGDHSAAVLYLHQMLAQLGYLPVHFYHVTPTERMFGSDIESPCASTWVWNFKHVPEPLRSVWDESTYNVITRAAVMTFQLEHGLPVDGFAGPLVFRTMELAVILNIHCLHPYTFVYVNQIVPQTITVWQEGKVAFRTVCSTGIAAAPTHLGTSVIYLRNREQTMTGETPSGGRYHVEHVPYVSFFHKGEAIHGLIRPQYGFPQSVGCVEVAIQDAKQIWSLTDYGTIVTVGPST